MSEIKRLSKHAGLITIAVFLSRILGVVREQILAYFFGAGLAMDAFVVAYRIPNLLRDLFAEGILGTAFTKVFSESLVKKGKRETFLIASKIISNLLIILLFVVAMGIVLAPFIVNLLASDFEKIPEKFALTVSLTRIMFPFLLFISLSSMIAGILNSFNIFFVPALSSALFNLTFILFALLGAFLIFPFLKIKLIYLMAWGVFFGGLFQVIFQIPSLKKLDFTFKFSPDFTLKEFKSLIFLIFPVILGMAGTQINILINTYFGTKCGEGAISWYTYAFRIMYVPLGLFGVALSQALLPKLTKFISQKKFTEAEDLFQRSLLLSLSLSIPSAIGLYLLSFPVVKLLFERGHFSPFDTLQTSLLLKILALSLPFYGLLKVCLPLFYSGNKTKIPPLGTFLSVIVNYVVVSHLYKTLGIRGVTIGMVSAIIFQGIFLLLASYLLFPFKFNFFYFLRGLFTLFLASLILVLTVNFCVFYFPTLILKIGTSIFFGGILFVGVCKIFGPEETYIFWKNFVEKFLKKINF